MTKRVKLDVELQVSKRDGYWAATTNPFNITVYADSSEKAEQRAVSALLSTLQRHEHEMTEYLTRLGVKHIITTQGSALPKPPERRSVKCELELQYA
ncbi:MAG: hypothetical protein Q7K03_01940 [Dehalococcoidia bacterium]|nr:hypothetical protein [Dehalococcoidia bacterium]